MGGTEVLCAASVEGRVPPFLRNSGQGWITAEYGMLPRATHTRGEREAARGKQSGRTQEIQRLIGRSLRAVVDRAALGEMTITLDCDVLNADGGTRCAAITGAWVALALALRHLQRMNVLKGAPLVGQVAAVSCGIVGAQPVLDLDYAEDSAAEADANFVLTACRRPRGSAGDGRARAVLRGRTQRPAGARAKRGGAAVRAAARGAGGVTAVRRLAAGARLVIATHNGGKLREIADLLAPHGVGAVSAGALGLPEPDETATDFVGNARLKAHAAAAAAGLPALADDSGLCAAGLGGAPGVVSARWAGPEKDFSAAMARVQRELGTNPDRRAAFVCALALAWPDGRLRDVLWPRRGHADLAAPRIARVRLRSDVRAPGPDQTFGEMAPAAKHALSHRARAFAQFVAACLP